MAEDSSKAPYSKEEHEAQAGSYGKYETIPLGVLEHQLYASALGDCKGLTVLDLGGGQGLRARQAIEHGAEAVDVVDLSPEMMREGQKIEESLGRGDSGVVQWFEGDASKPEELARLPLRSGDGGLGYDLVMANWTFDHCSSAAMLDGMLRSAVAHLRPGGRFVGTRVFHDPRTARAAAAGATASGAGKYGACFKDFVEIPGGVSYRYALDVDPPVEYDAASMEVTYEPALVEEYHARYGLVDTKIEQWDKAECIKSDPEFWATFLELPMMAVVSASKKAA